MSAEVEAMTVSQLVNDLDSAWIRGDHEYMETLIRELKKRIG